MKIYTGDAKPSINKLIATSIVALFLVLALSPAVTSEAFTSAENKALESIDDKELHLLRGEHYLYVKATDTVDDFHIRFCFQLTY